MYQNLTDEMQDSMKPLMNVFEIQNNTAQKLMREQMDFLGECLDVSTRHADALRDSRDATAFFRVPVDTSREISERWMNTAGRQWEILMEARDALNGEVESAAREMESTAKEATRQAESTARETTQQAESTARKAESTARKSNKSS